jgi:hypothetical protein
MCLTALIGVHSSVMVQVHPAKDGETQLKACTCVKPANLTKGAIP